MLKEFGSEVYATSVKEGKTDWMELPSIKEKIEMLRLTEANVNHFDRLRQDLEKHFELQKIQIRKQTEALIKALPDKSQEETS
jgi:type II secretory pathway component PulL